MRSKDHRNIETVKDWVSQTNVSQILVEMQMQRCERDTRLQRDNFSAFIWHSRRTILMALLEANTQRMRMGNGSTATHDEKRVCDSDWNMYCIVYGFHTVKDVNKL